MAGSAVSRSVSMFTRSPAATAAATTSKKWVASNGSPTPARVRRTSSKAASSVNNCWATASGSSPRVNCSVGERSEHGPSEPGRVQFEHHVAGQRVVLIDAAQPVHQHAGAGANQTAVQVGGGGVDACDLPTGVELEPAGGAGDRRSDRGAAVLADGVDAVVVGPVSQQPAGVQAGDRQAVDQRPAQEHAGQPRAGLGETELGGRLRLGVLDQVVEQLRIHQAGGGVDHHQRVGIDLFGQLLGPVGVITEVELAAAEQTAAPTVSPVPGGGQGVDRRD